MADLLNVTNPVSGYDNHNTNRNSPVMPGDPNVQNVPDPSRVGRADGRTDRQGADNNTKLRYDSNFQFFLQRLRASPGAVRILAQLLQSGFGTVAFSGMQEGISAEFANLMKMLSVNPEQLLELLKNQMTASNKFTGTIFDVLRDASAKAKGGVMQNDILRFLKVYNDFSARGHIERNILREIQQMTWFMPSRSSARLAEQLGNLSKLIGQGDQMGALKLLQGTIMPLMGEYVSRTHDLGIARDLLSLLMLDIARYESGTKDNVLQAFRQMVSHDWLGRTLGQLDEKTLMQILEHTEASKAAQKDHVSDALTALIGRALRGEGGPELRQAAQEIMNAILVNESVYMPLAHFMLPLEMDGRIMYGEMWVDPDAEQQQKGGKSGERTMRFLMKFDIQDLGLFDLVLSYQNGVVDMTLRCPPILTASCKAIETGLHEIAARNQVKFSHLDVAPMQKPLTITEVFPKIFDRKDSINVSI